MDGNWIKIALEVNGETHLTQLNTDLGVEAIIEGICREHGIAYAKDAFALKVRDLCRRVGTVYVTEENKSRLKHGWQLKLSKSPAERVGALIDGLHASSNAESSLANLRSLASASKDSVLLKELHKQNALQHLRVFASVRTLSEDEYYRMYKVFAHFLARGYANRLCDDEVGHLMEMITGDTSTGTDILVLAFDVFILLRRKGQLYWATKNLRKLIPYVRLYGEARLQEKALQFINVLYMSANDSEERSAILDFMKSSIMITYINKYVIRECLSQGMKHQLYLYQRAILRKYVKQFDSVDLGEEKIVENLEYVISNIALVNQMREVRVSAEAPDTRRTDSKRDGDRTYQILKSLKLSLPPIGRQRANSSLHSPTSPCKDRFGSRGSDCESEFFWRKVETGKDAGSVVSSESADEVFNEDEFASNTSRAILERRRSRMLAGEVPALARDNLYYFIINDFHSFEKFTLVHKNNTRSILGLSIEITALLCKIFEIDGAENGARTEQFVPLTFLYFDCFIEKMFCIAFRLFHRTRQDMGVPTDSPEYPVVLKTVGDQLEMALRAEPNEFVELENKLRELDVEAVARKRQEISDSKHAEPPSPVNSTGTTHPDGTSVFTSPVHSLTKTALKVLDHHEEEPRDFFRSRRSENFFHCPKALVKEDVERQLTLEPGFVELREICAPRIMDRIKEKRLAFMETGEHVPRFDYKGQKIPGKRLVLSVSKVRDRFVIEECGNNPCRSQHKLVENVPIADIREIEFGSKSNFHKEVYYNLYSERDMFFRSGIKQHEPDLRFPISLKLHNLNYIDFCAGSQLTMDYWIDGLRYLTGEKMESENTKEELAYLMDIELMSRLGELEGIKLPDKAPLVPPLPSNFDFVTD